MDSPRPAAIPPGLRLGFATAQLALVAGLLWYLVTAESEVDATETRVDWEFVAFAIVMPAALIVSFGLGWLLRRQSKRLASRATRYFADMAQGVTLILLVPTLLIAPLAAFGAIVFGPIG